MHPADMTIKEQDRGARIGRGQELIAAGGVLGALLASSCCALPLTLFSLGVSGAWISTFTQLAPYRPCFFAATLALLGTRILAGLPIF